MRALYFYAIRWECSEKHSTAPSGTSVLPSRLCFHKEKE